jgi:hypothetical protein
MDLEFQRDAVSTVEATDANTSTRMVQNARRVLLLAATVLEFQICALHMEEATDAK